MNCISINYKNTPEEVRGKISFTDSEKKSFFEKLKQENKIDGIVIVSTCNRTEFYYDFSVNASTVSGNDIAAAESEDGFISASELESEITDYIVSQISDIKNIDSELIKKYGLFFEDGSAINHLFRVVFGLESMVLGEDEIFHQVKEAYLFSKEQDFLSKDMNIIFQDAFHGEKESKQRTDFKRTPVSIGTLTANYIEKYIDKNGAGNGMVLVIGASGQIGSVVARDLIDKGISVIGTTRKTHHSKGYYVIPGDDIKWIPFEDRFSVFQDVSVIVSATSSPHFTITKEDYFSSECKAKLLIDLAVPNDIDRAISVNSASDAGNVETAASEGVTIASENIQLLGIDYFKELSKKNNEEKKNSIEAAEEILKEESEKTEKKLFLKSLVSNPAFQKLSDEVKKNIFYLKEPLDRETFEKAVNEIISYEG